MLYIKCVLHITIKHLTHKWVQSTLNFYNDKRGHYMINKITSFFNSRKGVAITLIIFGTNIPFVSNTVINILCVILS